MGDDITERTDWQSLSSKAQKPVNEPLSFQIWWQQVARIVIYDWFVLTQGAFTNILNKEYYCGQVNRLRVLLVGMLQVFNQMHAHK